MSLTPGTRRVLPLVVLLLGLGACDGSTARSGPEEDLTGLPGVASAAVTEQEVDQDQVGTIVVVDVDADITDDQLGTVFTRVAALDPDRWVVSLGCGRAQWDRFNELDDCDAATGTNATDGRTPAERARVLLAGSRAFPDAHVTLDRDALVVELGDPASATVAPALATVLADPVLSGTGDLTVTADPLTAPRFSVETHEPLREETAALWQQLLVTLARLPDGVPGGVLLSANADGTTQVWTQIELPGVVPPAQLVPDRDGAALWPYLRAQLDVVAGLPQGSTYVAENRYRTTADGPASASDVFVSVTRGAAGEPDDLGRAWNVDAARYLGSMS